MKGRAHHRPPPSLGLRPVKSAHQLRRDWVEAIALSAAAARHALGEPVDGVWAGQARLMVALRELAHDNFPVATWSARQVAAAFLTLARSFVRPEMGPEARTACAAFLGAGAAALDEMLAALRGSEADAWRGQTGERGD